jgi:hypothetical protein
VLLNEEAREIHMTIERCPIHWSRPIPVLGCRVGTVLDEELGETLVTFA